MVNYRMVAEVHRKSKGSAKFFKIAMILFGVLFMLMGIMFSRAFMLPCFLMAGLYFVFDANAERDYEYIYEDNVFSVDVIKGKKRRKRAMELNLERLVVLAPHDHDAVAPYKKKGGTIQLDKYDYTSYDDDIPYYTMIIMTENKTEIKVLLDLTDEMMQAMKRKYPQKVYMAG